MAIDARLSVLISSPKPENLSKQQRRFLQALSKRIEQAGLHILPDSVTSDKVEDRFQKVSRCHGVVVFAASQWEAERLSRAQGKSIFVTSEFSHIVAAIAVAARRPLLVLREKAVAERGVLRAGYLDHIVKVPNSLEPEWVEGPEFAPEFDKWVKDVECHRHVFLGYSSQAAPVADKIYKFLSTTLRLRVFDWHEFHKSEAIWENIERAACYSTCGIFLFMADDKLAAREAGFAPRDNVVYEAGYFAGTKGRKQVLIIREDRAKLPTDLGGILYQRLASRTDISGLETPLTQYLEQALT